MRPEFFGVAWIRGAITTGTIAKGGTAASEETTLMQAQPRHS